MRWRNPCAGPGVVASDEQSNAWRATMSRLWLCVIVSCVELSTVAPVRGDDAEDRAVTFVEKSGGKVTRNEELPGKPIVRVDLYVKTTDADLKELAALKTLRALDLSETKVTDAGLKELAALENLRELD